MSIWNISPEDTKVLLGGIYEVVGFSDGTYVSIEKVNQPFSSTRAMDGTIVRTHHYDRQYIIKLTLAQSSVTNDILTKLWQVDELTKAAQIPVLFKDNLGSTLFFGTTCWVNGIPPVTYSNSVEVREWTLDCSDGYINIGSNSSDTNISEDVINILISAAPLLEGLI